MCMKCACFVLFHPIKKRSFNLLCVLDLFSRTLAVNSVSDFLNVKGSLEDCGVKTLQCFSRSSFHRLTFGTGSRLWKHPGMSVGDIHTFEDKILNEGVGKVFNDWKWDYLSQNQYGFFLEIMSINVHHALNVFLLWFSLVGTIAISAQATCWIPPSSPHVPQYYSLNLL